MAKERNQVPEQLKWRVEDIFETPEDFEKTYAEVESLCDLSEFEGKLSDRDSLCCTIRIRERRHTPHCFPASITSG